MRDHAGNLCRVPHKKVEVAGSLAIPPGRHRTHEQGSGGGQRAHQVHHWSDGNPLAEGQGYGSLVRAKWPLLVSVALGAGLGVLILGPVAAMAGLSQPWQASAGGAIGALLGQWIGGLLPRVRK